MSRYKDGAAAALIFLATWYVLPRRQASVVELMGKQMSTMFDVATGSGQFSPQQQQRRQILATPGLTEADREWLISLLDIDCEVDR